MTTEDFWLIVNKQKEWKKMYEQQQMVKQNKFKEWSRMYQEVRRRRLGIEPKNK